MTDQMQTIEQVLVAGDLSRFTAEQKILYYERLCESLGLNKLTKPFEYLSLQGKLVLYATKNCTEQLRQLHGVSITNLTGQRIDDVYIVTATAVDKHGRTDCATGAVSLGNLKADALCNAYMKAETKSKRRVTLSLCSLGMLDESELDTIAGAKIIANVNGNTVAVQPTVAGVAVVEELAPIATITDFCNWAMKTYPDVFADEADIKETLRSAGISTWSRSVIERAQAVIAKAANQWGREQAQQSA